MRSIKVEGLDIPWTALTLGCLQIAPSKEWGRVFGRRGRPGGEDRPGGRHHGI
jgi:hypothetical protein